MADKPRVKAPKQIKAPKQRATHAPADPARRRRMLYLVGGVGLALAVFVLGAALAFGGGSDARAALRDAGCTLEIKPAKGVGHAVRDPGGTSKNWNTDPPTSGPHHGVAAVFHAYDEPLEPARVVHNLEHGGVFIQYGDKVPESTVQQLLDFWNDHKPGTILAPYPRLGNKIALGAWVWTAEELANGAFGNGYLAKCSTFDEGAFSAFLDEFQFRGSHGNDPDVLQPGH